MSTPYPDKPRLNSVPRPRKGKTHTFMTECEEGVPELAPVKMCCFTDAQLKLLGRVYDWCVLQGHRGGGTKAFFDTTLTQLDTLKAKGLVKHPSAKTRERYMITQLGIRVYGLNYWLREHRINKRLEERFRARREAQRERAARFTNPLPNTFTPENY